jgi:hypothetical protein
MAKTKWRCARRRRGSWHTRLALGSDSERSRSIQEALPSKSIFLTPVDFPNSDAANPQYIENLRSFVKKCKETAETSEEEVHGANELGLDSNRTTADLSEASTPRERLIYYTDERIGKGSFGEVHRVIRMRDGKEFAAKTFTLSESRGQRYSTLERFARQTAAKIWPNI